jgi:hypothetical protein
LLRLVNDDMIDAADWHDFAGTKRHRLRQTRQARADPGGMRLDESFCAGDGAARRHGEHDIARCGPHAERETPR